MDWKLQRLAGPQRFSAGELLRYVERAWRYRHTPAFTDWHPIGGPACPARLGGIAIG